MKDQKDYTRDIEEIRSMMERSTKFPSLSGWAGIMVGLYALFGAYIAYAVLHFNPDDVVYRNMDPGSVSGSLQNVGVVAITVLMLAVGTAIFLTNKKAGKSGEKIWNATSRRLLVNLSLPLAAGGIFIVILLSKGLVGLAAPSTLLFYGFALYNASKFTYDEIKFMGLIQLGLGLISSYFVEYSLLCWTIGFGVVHIVYGIYMHFKYER